MTLFDTRPDTRPAARPDTGPALATGIDPARWPDVAALPHRPLRAAIAR